MAVNAPALAVPRSGRFQSPSGTEIALARPGYAGAGSTSYSITEDDVLRPLVLGSMRVGGVPVSHAGRVAGRMAGDLSPQDWNRPDSRTAKAAAGTGRDRRAN